MRGLDWHHEDCPPHPSPVNLLVVWVLVFPVICAALAYMWAFPVWLGALTGILWGPFGIRRAVVGGTPLGGIPINDDPERPDENWYAQIKAQPLWVRLLFVVVLLVIFFAVMLMLRAAGLKS
jgi:hypothetical protein